MTTVYDPFEAAEFAVEFYDGTILVGRTTPTGDPEDAKKALRKLTYAYPDARIVWRQGACGSWETIDEDGLNRMAYQRTAAIVSHLIGEGPAKVNWYLSNTRPNHIEGHCLATGDPREALTAYADLLNGKVTESPHRDDRVKLTAEGTYHGLTVEVWDLVMLEQETGDEQPAEVPA